MAGAMIHPPSRARSAIWSAVVPGLGQWLGGRRRRGVLFAVPALAGLIVAFAVVFEVRRAGVASLVRLLVEPFWLWTLIVANALLAIERVVAVIDAWRTGERASAWWLAPAMGLLGLVLVPHLVVHQYGMEAIALIDTVFGTPDAGELAGREARLLDQGVSEADLGPVGESSVTTVVATTLGGGTDTALPAVTSTIGTPRASTPIAYPEVAPLVVDFGESLGDRYTVLLAGGDFGPGRHDLRTDVMIVAHVDLVVGKVSLIGISRELANVPLPAAWSRYRTMIQVQEWHELQAWRKDVAEAEAAGIDPPLPPGDVEPCDCFFDRINYLHVLTANWVRTFPDAPDPGMEALRQTLEGFLGIPIDAYVLVDFAGFVDLVDALGGVHVSVTESMHVGFSPAKEGEDPVRVNVDPGVHLLDGRQALAYVRNRTGSSDDERMRRQRCLIRDLAAEADARTLLFNFPTIVRAIRDHTTTTLPLALVPEILEVVGNLGTDDIATLSIGSTGWSKGQNYLGLPIVDAARVRRAVADLLAGVATGATLGDVATDCPVVEP